MKSWWQRKNLRPPHVILWTLIWIIPAHIARILFVAVIFCGWGRWAAEHAWDDTK